MSKVFISHSSNNKDFVRRLASDLTDLGHQTWFDEREIRVGDCIATKIELGVSEADFVIVVLSQQAVKSGWVEKEWKSKYWDEINQGRISVLPVLIDDCVIPQLLKTKRFADFRRNYATGLVNLTNAINQGESIPISLANNLYSLGIKHIHKDRDSIRFREQILESESGSVISVLGIALTNFAIAAMRRPIEMKLKEGCMFRMLSLNPDSDLSRHLAEEVGKNYQVWREALTHHNEILKQFRHLFPAEVKDNMEIRYYSSAPAYFMFIRDSSMIVGFYVRDRIGADSPHLELSIQEGGLCDPFLQHFDSLWNDKKTIVM